MRACDWCPPPLSLPVFQKLLVSSASARELLERELMTHARIGNHPHIVELYGVYQDPTTGQLCAVLQLMQGAWGTWVCAHVWAYAL